MPEGASQMPEWFQEHGYRAKLGTVCTESAHMTITTPYATLSIAATERQHLWQVSVLRQGGTILNVHLDTKELLNAFRRSSTTCSKPATYLRVGDYLAIPEPGSHFAGNQRVCVLLTDEINVAIRQLVQTYGQKYPAYDLGLVSA